MYIYPCYILGPSLTSWAILLGGSKTKQYSQNSGVHGKCILAAERGNGYLLSGSYSFDTWKLDCIATPSRLRTPLCLTIFTVVTHALAVKTSCIFIEMVTYGLIVQRQCRDENELLK